MQTGVGGNCGCGWRGVPVRSCRARSAVARAGTTTRGSGSGGTWTPGITRRSSFCGVRRVECPDRGVATLPVPWAEGRSRYTAAFETEVIAWLREASVLTVSRRMGMSWNAVSGIMERAVRRGLERREMEPVQRLSVDETSFKRGHQYVTVLSDPDTKRVLDVVKGRSREALESLYRRMGREWLAAARSVSMDMWRPYVAATLAWVAGAEEKVAFDRFHMAKHLLAALDKVRRAEHREQLAEGDAVLSRTGWQWLVGRAKMTHAEKLAFAELRKPWRRRRRRGR